MLGLLAAVLMQGSTTAPLQAPLITQPTWVKLPAAEDMAKFYPAGAVTARVEGRAMITCTVIATGDLTKCQVMAEEPAGQGFGEAALAMSSLFKMLPKTKSGQPVDGAQINIPIRFALPAGPVGPRQLTEDDIVWEKKPIGSEFVKYYPEGAARAGVGGKVLLHCIVDANGKLSPCEVTSEVPAGRGFGDAARKFVTTLKMRRTLADGTLSEGAAWDFPMTFGIPR